MSYVERVRDICIARGWMFVSIWELVELEGDGAIAARCIEVRRGGGADPLEAFASYYDVSEGTPSLERIRALREMAARDLHEWMEKDVALIHEVPAK